MFLKLKNGEVTIKGRVCVDGRNKWTWIPKEEIPSPTVPTEFLMMPCMIDAIEGCDAATDEIPGEFQQID